MKNIRIHNKAQKFINSIKDKDLLHKIEQHIFGIASELIIGEFLEHPFRKYDIKKISIKYKNVEYRILYCIVGDSLYLFVIGPRENFYKNLDIKKIREYEDNTKTLDFLQPKSGKAVLGFLFVGKNP